MQKQHISPVDLKYVKNFLHIYIYNNESIDEKYSGVEKLTEFVDFSSF